jgi:hypothetical protein
VLLKRKDQALQAFQIVKMAAEVEAEAKLKALCTDRGGEFKFNEFKEFCEAHGIQWYLIAPYSPQQNGVVERRNQTVVAMVRSMMKNKGMPGRFWGEAVSTAVYLLNRTPTKSVVGMPLYEAWYGRKPSVDHLRTFGCVVHVKTVTGHTSKLVDRSTPMVMIGYEAGTKAYRAYNPVNKKFVVTRDILFEEEKSWNLSSAEPVHSISNEIFNIVYVDDLEARSDVAAETDVTGSDDHVSSPRSEAGTSVGSTGSARPRPGSPRVERAGETTSFAWSEDSPRGSVSGSLVSSSGGPEVEQDDSPARPEGTPRGSTRRRLSGVVESSLEGSLGQAIPETSHARASPA